MNILKISRIFLLLAGLFFCFGSTVHAALLMHLPLDGNLNDISGNANNGAFPGGSRNPGFATAVFNQGLNFDGNNDFITVPSFDPGSTFSASLWVNHDNIGALNTFIEHTNNGNNRNDFYIGYDNSNNQLTVELEDNNNFEGGACGNPKFCTGIALNSNRWYHVVVTVTPTTLNVFIDTVLAYTASHSTAVNFGNGSWLLGGDTDNNPVTSANNDYLDGRIDEVRIYNHELSQSEISALFGLTGFWTFDDCSITNNATITDSSGYNNNATALGGVSSTTGKICTAGLFDGSSGYVQIPHNAVLNGSSALTYSAWINPTTWSGGIRQIIAKSVHGGGSGRAQMGIFSEGGVLKGRAETAGGQREISMALPSTGSWHHVALVFNGNTLTLYVDGSSNSTAFVSTTLNSTTDELDISKRVGSSQYFFDGAIDEVRVFNRALQTEEITGYNANPDPLNRTCPTCDGGTQTIILSTDNTETLGGLNFSDGSLAEYDPVAYSSTLYFNENLFSGGADINAVHVLSNSIIILSTDNNETLGGLSFGDDDLIAYDPSNNTATLYFDGGALFSNNFEDIDAVYVRDNGNIILSTTGDATLGGISFSDGDLIEYIPSTDSASLFFDESNFSGGADIDGVHILANGNILISTNNTESLPGLANFEDGSIVEYDVGTNTASLYFDENLFSGGADIDALTLPSSVTPLHHIQITHDGTALTCEPESITVTACANATCTAPHYASDVSITLAPSGWVGGDTQTIISGSSIFQLRNSIAGTVTLAALASSPATSITPSPSVSCLNSVTSSTSCDLTYYDSGFIYTVPTQTSCATSNNITIQAVRLDVTSQTCVPAFQNVNRNLKVWASYSSPAPAVITGTPEVTLVNGNGTYTLPSTVPGATNVTMTFASSADETFTVAYPDAGQLILNTKYEGSAANSDTGLTMLGNSTFVVKPHNFFLEAAYDNSGTEVALNNATTSGTPIWKASDNFRLRLRGQCQAGTITQNYVPTNAQIFIELSQPATGGTHHNLTIQGSNYPSSYAATPDWRNISSKFSSGAITNGTDNYADTAFHEVGVLNLHVRDTQYITAGITLAEQTLTVGRFTPHHFDTSLIHGCTGGGNFTYSGQNFSVTATARNNNGGTPEITKNYDSTLAKGVEFSNAGDTTNFTTNTLSGGVSGDFVNGIGNNANVTYTFPTKETPSVTLILRSIDSDDISSTGYIEETTEIRSGRIHLENSFGSELVDMSITAQIEYFDLTTNDYAVNTSDTCTAISVKLTDPDLGDFLITGDGNVTGETCIWDDAKKTVENLADPATDFSCLADATKPQFSQPPTNGSFNLYLKAPLVTGDMGITLLSTPLWLQLDADGDGNPDGDPTGTASFGLYRGDDRVIYWREVF